MATGGFLLAVFILGLTGCASSSGGGGWSGRGSDFHELHLFVRPLPLQANPTDGAYGLAVRVFASNRSRPKGVPISSGTLEILAYDGTLPEAGAPPVQPAQVWSHPAANLPPFAVTSSLGTGYELALQWQGLRPRSSRLTLVARLVFAPGTSLQSAPSVIVNALK
ncbi:MAG: hypothetical protein ACKODH_11385 [Limisphaerales bacterium]